jgi:hypothetical protein
MNLAHLPGGALVSEGVADLAAGRETVASLLVGIARGRLARAGVELPPEPPAEEAGGDLELRLYARLCETVGKAAYGRYNSLLRELDSCARALEREQGARMRAARR